MKKIIKWARKNYNRIVTSIAFYPALIAIGFLILSWVMLDLDFTPAGKSLKARFAWIRLKDASTARTVVSTIVSGIISLTVFSFSMVMILLNQAASQMSNRMLDSMIGNRFQQVVLGFYIGTIVYALFLLTSIRDIDAGIYVPALSIYLLVLLTIADIFLFIYFLHYVTQSVKFETVIKRLHRKTRETLLNTCNDNVLSLESMPLSVLTQDIYMPSSGYFQGIDTKAIVVFARKHRGAFYFAQRPGTYLLGGSTLLLFYGTKELLPAEVDELMEMVDIYNGQPVEKNYFYGYHQLTEVSLKALSPGINDPQTAVLSLHQLCDLLIYQLHHFTQKIFKDDAGIARVQVLTWDFGSLFEECIAPIWHYGKNDRYIRHAMGRMMEQLKRADINGSQTALLDKMLGEMQTREDTEMK